MQLSSVKTIFKLPKVLGSQLDSNARPSRLKFDGLPPEPSNSSLLFPIVTRVIRDLFQTVFSQLIKVSRTDLARAGRASCLTIHGTQISSAWFHCQDSVMIGLRKIGSALFSHYLNIHSNYTTLNGHCWMMSLTTFLILWFKWYVFIYVFLVI